MIAADGARRIYTFTLQHYYTYTCHPAFHNVPRKYNASFEKSRHPLFVLWKTCRDLRRFAHFYPGERSEDGGLFCVLVYWCIRPNARTYEYTNAPPAHSPTIPIFSGKNSSMKQVYIFSLILLVFSALMFAGCGGAQPEEAPRHLFAEFFVRYLQTERELKAHATFFEGDSIQTAIPKAFAGGATFQGVGMNARNLPGGTVRYALEQHDNYADTFRFSFKDDLGIRRDIPVAMAPIDSFSVRDEQISKSTGMALYARGGRLTKGESMVLFFSDQDNKASTILLTGPSAGEEYRIPAAKVETFAPGNYDLYLVKKKREVVKGDTISTMADIEYYTNTIKVEVVE